MNGCLQHARLDSGEQLTVLGLVQAWGEVALHGNEGFRAANAAVIALFTDWVWQADGEPGSHDRSWWWRLFHAGEAHRRRTPPDPNREDLLTSVGMMYGVPVLSLADALRSGFLGEMGVDAGRLEEVRRLVGPHPTSGQGPSHQGRHPGVGDAA